MYGQYFYYFYSIYSYIVNVKILQEVFAKVTDFCKILIIYKHPCGPFRGRPGWNPDSLDFRYS